MFLEELINTRYYWWVCYSSDCHNNCKNPHVFVASCLLSVQALVWVDCEMTGLGSDGGPGDDSLLEAGRWSVGRHDFSLGFFDWKLLPGNVKMILFSRFFCGPHPLWCFMRNGFSLTKSFGQKRCLIIPSMLICVYINCMQCMQESCWSKWVWSYWVRRWHERAGYWYNFLLNYQFGEPRDAQHHSHFGIW